MAKTYALVLPTKVTYNVGDVLNLAGGKVVVSEDALPDVEVLLTDESVAVDVTVLEKDGTIAVAVDYNNAEWEGSFNVTVKDIEEVGNIHHQINTLIKADAGKATLTTAVTTKYNALLTKKLAYLRALKNGTSLLIVEAEYKTATAEFNAAVKTLTEAAYTI